MTISTGRSPVPAPEPPHGSAKNVELRPVKTGLGPPQGQLIRRHGIRSPVPVKADTCPNHGCRLASQRRRTFRRGRKVRDTSMARTRCGPRPPVRAHHAACHTAPAPQRGALDRWSASVHPRALLMPAAAPGVPGSSSRTCSTCMPHRVGLILGSPLTVGMPRTQRVFGLDTKIRRKRHAISAGRQPGDQGDTARHRQFEQPTCEAWGCICHAALGRALFEALDASA